MTSRLTVGTERLDAKPPRGNPPCTEPIKYGSNVLRDPGFELHLANNATGPNGEHFAEVGDMSAHAEPKWADSTTLAIRPLMGWAVKELNGVGLNAWKISTANPRTGTYHMRRTIPSVDDFIHDPEDFYPVGLFPCTLGGTATARANPGDFVQFSCWSMVNTTTDFPTCSFFVEFWNEAGTQLDSLYFEGNLTTVYTQFSASAFAPAGAFWLVIEVALRKTGFAPAVDTHFDVDDCVLQVSK